MNKRLLTARIVMTVLCVAVTAFIFINSLFDAQDSSEQSSSVTELINSLFRALGIHTVVSELVVRKLAHFTEYAVLGALLNTTAFLYGGKRMKALLTALPIGALTAVTDELIQNFSQGRNCQVTDMLIDFSGICCGALITWLIISLLKKRKQKNRNDIVE